MKPRLFVLPAAIAAIVLLSLGGGSAVAKPDAFTIDGAHSSIVFKIKHSNVSYVYGLFTEMSGSFDIDEESPAASKVTMEVKSASVETGQKGRDEHLRGADFLNCAQFPTLTFASTSVKRTGNVYEVTGDFTLHGVTKSVTIPMEKIGSGPGMRGGTVMGLEGTVEIKRSEFGMAYGVDKGLGDVVRFIVSVQGKKP